MESTLLQKSYQVMVPYSSGDSHGSHKSTLLAPSINDWQKYDVIRNDVTTTPSRHVEVLVKYRFPHILFSHFARKDVAIEKLEKIVRKHISMLIMKFSEDPGN